MNTTSTFIARVTATPPFAEPIEHPEPQPILTLSFIAVMVCAISLGYTLVVTTYLSPFRKLQRPPMRGFWSFIMGNLIEMQQDDPGVIQMRVSSGAVTVLQMFTRLLTSLIDHVAIPVDPSFWRSCRLPWSPRDT